MRNKNSEGGLARGRAQHRHPPELQPVLLPVFVLVA